MIRILNKCVLFKNFTSDEITTLFENLNPNVNTFQKNEVVALEDSDCSSIGIVLEGSVEIQKIYASGKAITIERLMEGQIFGEVSIFSNHHRYPATIISTEKTSIMFIFKEDVIKLCGLNNIFLTNFMTLLSNKILMLNQKVKILSYKTIKQKIAHLLLEEYKKQKNLLLKLDLTKKEMAQSLGVERPSLSREFISLIDEDIIEIKKNFVQIIDLEGLENILLE